VNGAIDAARCAAITTARAVGTPIPNLGGLATFIRSKAEAAFALARNVSIGRTPRAPGQFVAMLPAGSVRTAVAGFGRAVGKVVPVPAPSVPATRPPVSVRPVGGDRDARGCKPSAGYR
jgi:hypothetical protein